MQKQQFSNKQTFLFVVILCFSCALILSVLSYILREPQINAKELYKSKQLLRAAAILSDDCSFMLPSGPASYDSEKGILVPSSKTKAKARDILALFEARIHPRVTDSTGKLYTFEEASLNEEDYMHDNAKYGYAKLPYKLLYIVKPNLPPEKFLDEQLPYGYVIPVNGYGLWDAIYGYLGLETDADTILGMTWYDQKETPGLGGNIILPKWQAQFKGKVIFQRDAQGKTSYEFAPIGIKVVKTTVQETYGKAPISASAVDGIAGASITVSGVNEALRNSLTPYRPFLIKAHERSLK